MVRDRQEVTTETDMSHTSEHDTWRGNITLLSVSLATSHFCNIFLTKIFNIIVGPDAKLFFQTLLFNKSRLTAGHTS